MKAFERNINQITVLTKDVFDSIDVNWKSKAINSEYITVLVNNRQETKLHLDETLNNLLREVQRAIDKTYDDTCSGDVVKIYCSEDEKYPIFEITV